MKRGIWAATLLLTSAGFASADYVILVANVGGATEAELKGAGGAGMPGMAGMRGGMPGGMPGMGGMRGGMPGMGGMRGGMPAPNMGRMGGMMMGGNAGFFDTGEVPYFIIAVVEVKSRKLVQNFKEVENYKEQAKAQQIPIDKLQFATPVNLPERLGKSCTLLNNPPLLEMFLVADGRGKPIPTVADRFNAEFEKLKKEKPSVGDLLRLAEWTLEHGLVDKFPLIMDKLVEIDKGHPAAVAYVKVKADLDRKAEDDPSVSAWRGKLLPGYKTSETSHYLIVHDADAVADKVELHSKYLENAFHSFYYWFALKQTDSKRPLPSVPRYRQIVILTGQPKDFEQLHKILTSGPVVVDGFFARRENLSVMSSKHQDDSYAALNTYWKSWESKGYNRFDLLSGKRGNKSGVPANAQSALDVATAQTLALMLKALEQEAVLATVSHDASRQLLFASGLLPGNVAAPEWILFGMGSFFETPPQAPWPTVAAPSPYYLPPWREYKKDKGGLEKTRLATLRKVVTDGYFRTLPPDGKADSEEHRLYKAALLKARTVSWSLTYYLAQQKLDGLRRYFAELSKMPRDLELDDVVLLGCFARAFGCVDSGNKVDDAKLSVLANEWFNYWQRVNFESEPTMKDIREKIAKKVKEAEEQAQKQNDAKDQNSGAFPGGLPGGVGGPGGFGPRGPGGMGPQPGGPFPQGGGRNGPGKN